MSSNRYDKYKYSGIEWIGEIPDSWKLVKTGRIFRNTKEIVGEKSMLVERFALTLNGVIKRSKSDSEGLQPEQFNSYQYLRKNQLVFKLIDLENVNTSRVGLCDFEEGMVSPAYIVLCNNNLNNRYYYYYFISLWHNEIFNHLGGDGVRSALNAKDLLAIPTFDISIKEQKMIAGYLDRKCGAIDETIEKQKSVIEKLKEYKQSIITQAVTKGLDKSAPMKDSDIEWIGQIPQHWEVRKLKTIGDYRNGLTYSPEDICEENNGTLVLRSSNIKNGKISFNDNVYVSSNIPEILKVKKGDILICSRNGSKDLIGKNALITEDINASFGAFMMIFRCKCPQYLYNVLNSHIFSYYLGSFFTSTINQLTGKNFGSMDIVYCPNINEQNQINDYLEKKCSEIDKTIEDKEKLIEKLVEYKKSLIYECVTGKRKVI